MDGNKERGWPSPRSWERVAMELELAERKNLDKDLLQIIIEGLVGDGTALEFMAFLEWSGKIPDIGRMLAGEAKVTIPKRSDQRHAMLSAIVHNLRQHEKPELLLDGLFEIIHKFPSDWAQLLYHDVTLVMDKLGMDDFLEEMFDHPRHVDLENKILV
tara:strand:- start:159 stop:632 length:474 start_codon:yes stop_codon:yes gene_type:complete